MQTYSLQEVSETVIFLKSLAEKMLKQIKKTLNRDVHLGIITFFGDCSYVSHGIGIGAAIGIALDNVPVGIGVSMALGISIVAIMNTRKSKNK